MDENSKGRFETLFEIGLRFVFLVEAPFLMALARFAWDDALPIRQLKGNWPVVGSNTRINWPVHLIMFMFVLGGPTVLSVLILSKSDKSRTRAWCALAGMILAWMMWQGIPPFDVA